MLELREARTVRCADRPGRSGCHLAEVNPVAGCGVLVALGIVAFALSHTQSWGDMVRSWLGSTILNLLGSALFALAPAV